MSTPASADGAMSNTRMLVIIAIVVTLLTGTFASVANKALYQLNTDGIDSSSCGANPHQFQKAYMTTVFMFIGEAMCLGYYFAEKWYRRRFSKSGSAQLKEVDPVEPTEPTGTKPPLWNYLVLSCFDLSATAISGVGLVWVSASATLMLRGSGVLFTALFSICLLRRRLSKREWLGILIVCFGLGAVGGSAAYHAKLQEDSGEKSDDATNATPLQAAIGVILILVGSALNSVQGVVEEKLLKVTGDAEIHPLEVVGWEGVFGFFSSSFILLPVMHAIPGNDCGSQENSLDSLAQMHNNYLVDLLLVGYAFALALMNYYSQVISKYLSAVHRNLISTLRTILVWVVSIILYYALTHGSFGEAWDKSSYIQLAGFVLLVAGTMIYGLKPPVDKPAESDPLQSHDPTHHQELSQPLIETDGPSSDDYPSHSHTQPLHYQHRSEVD